MAARCGNAAEGADLCRHALDMSDALGDPAGSAQALNYLGSINRDQGQHAAAAARHARALQLAHQAGERWGTCLALDGLAGTALVDGEWTVAVHLLAYSQKLAQRAGYMPAPHELQARDADVARARAERSLAEFQGAWARGADADETEIVAYALTFARRYVSDPGRFRPRSASRATLASPDVELPAFEPAPGGAR